VFEAALHRVPAGKRKAIVSANKNLDAGAIGTVNLFVKILQSEFPDALEQSNIIRALLLQGDPDVMEIAYNWLQGLDVDPADRRKLNLTAASPTHEELVRGISWLMSLGGPTLIAIDQIDSIVAASNLAADRPSTMSDETESTARGIIHLFSDGLINLREITTRSMTVVSCLGETWTILREKVLASVAQRFSDPVFLRPASVEAGQITDLVASRLRPAYAQDGDAPPYETWPFSPRAIAGIGDVLPWQRGEVGLIGRGAVKARVWTPAIIKVKHAGHGRQRSACSESILAQLMTGRAPCPTLPCPLHDAFPTHAVARWALWC
jgi:hypothetical protein